MFEDLKLSGKWSYTDNNGGFHTLKAEGVSISFYPGTKTLNVQVAKVDIIRTKLLNITDRSRVSNDGESLGYNMPSATQASRSDCENDDEEEEEEDTEEEREEQQQNVSESAGISNPRAKFNDVEIEPNNAAVSANYPYCHCNCDKNTTAIADLIRRFNALEAKLVERDSSPSYDELLVKVKTLEEERDSLLTALRLLKEDFNQAQGPQSTPTTHQNVNTNGSGANGFEWREVKLRQDTGKRGRVNQTNSNTNGSRNEEILPKEKVIIIGDSMTKFVDPKKLSKKCQVESRSFPGVTVEDMQDFVKPLVRRKPDKVTIHVGTINLNKDRPKQIKNKIADLVGNIKTQEPTVQIAVSSIVRRADSQRLNDSISQVNKALETVCKSNGWDFISHDNISVDCLNNSGLHLNRKGVFNLARNFRNYLHTN